MNQFLTVAACAGICLSLGQAYAANVEVTTGHVVISFDDQASYFAEAGTWYGGTFFQTYQTAPYAGNGNALVLTSAISNPVGGSGYADGGFINFSLFDFNFAPQAGYQITGYRISFSGVAEQVGAGSYSIDGTNGSLSFSGNNYTFTSNTTSDLLDNPFYGSIILDAPYVEGPDGTALVFGTAYASVDTISIEAVTQAIPEPETYALMLGGLGILGVRRRRRLNRPSH